MPFANFFKRHRRILAVEAILLLLTIGALELLRNKKILQKKKTKTSNIQYCHSESRALYY
ncbi:hypothetical protein VU01_12252 [Candidatus Electrothrix marina]|uniref:Uncharacterized protein n=1 Tax=Candidatus Electrothrix marina TaxID=1859130 RepID=A0A444JD77_9BACT|nr:hypothetical protein VU01_12252 [Candidatus Electrothrix marina]